MFQQFELISYFAKLLIKPLFQWFFLFIPLQGYQKINETFSLNHV